MKGTGEEGGSLVELSLCLVVFLMLVFGVIDACRAVYAYNFIERSSKQAARYALVRGRECTGLPDSCPAWNGQNNPPFPPCGGPSHIKDYIDAKAVGIDIDPTVLKISAACYVGPNVMGCLPCPSGQDVIIKIDYQFSPITPFWPGGPWWMHAYSQMPVQ